MERPVRAGKGWLLEQQKFSSKEREQLVRSVEDANGTIAKMEEAKGWFLQQQVSAEREIAGFEIHL
jgi:hypothetical protein